MKEEEFGDSVNRFPLGDSLKGAPEKSRFFLYSVADLKLFKKAIELKVIPKKNLQVLYVLGRYEQNFQSKKEDLDLFLEEHKNILSEIDWGICAFGRAETECLIKSNFHGGKIRVGFENNFYNQDGTLASSNAERVAEIYKLISD